MCRTAGRRCSDHPRRKYLKYAEKANRIGSEAEEALIAMGGIEMQFPDAYEENEDYQKLKGIRANLLKEMDATEKLRDEELANFYTTPAGQEHLKSVIANEAASNEDKIDANSEQIAGAERRINQNHLGALLSDPDLSPETKMFIAKNEIRRSLKAAKIADKRINQIKRQAVPIQEMIHAAENENDPVKVARLKKKLASLMVEMNYLQKQSAQRKGRAKDLQGWTKRFVAKNFDKAFDGIIRWNDVMIGAVIDDLF